MVGIIMKEILYFGADFCPQCKALKPRVEKWCQDNGVVFRYIDAENDVNNLMRYDVRSIPTVVAVHGNVKTEKLFGTEQWNEFENRMKESKQ